MSNDNQIIDITSIMDMLQTLTPDDIKRIDLSDSFVRKLKREPNTLYNTRVSTLMKLRAYQLTLIMEDSLQEFVGIDLGSVNHITSSSKDMTRTCVIKSPYINKVVAGYNNKLTEYENIHYLSVGEFKTIAQNAVNRLYSQIYHETLRTLAKEIASHHGHNAIFVIGSIHNISLRIKDNKKSRKVAPSAFNIMRKAFHDGLKQYVKKRTSKVIEIDENGTSVLCPKCQHSSRKNRNKNNRFDCQKCNFSHENDDVVAACNIVNTYIKNHIER